MDNNNDEQYWARSSFMHVHNFGLVFFEVVEKMTKENLSRIE